METTCEELDDKVNSKFIPFSSGALDKTEKVQIMRLKAPMHHTSRAPCISLLTTRRVPTADYWAVRSKPIQSQTDMPLIMLDSI